ncbi:hypothetical protein F441_10694 [Phytophthora nicotianae CJ01A1]|uniref:Uncharacterized protein n=5 Tax=Phytophthora nicotianae TaxID=4792 RepID=W2Z648_PHYNI|nr:hypothetical protein L915_10507 [Phytophthora nicotianae]ETO73191.1 hypothetical protein F444_10851 [Phytophthora nicotianae P1976]ETP14370.1 hypothetical protein F441_10694 [Phytophthora nicotianae CJ01A1]ETP42441.1 hypothetical protein F442_10664 [Phytophthora nicotianae P10297]KUF77858.1 WW domain-containing oxidoreductase [Phytophthora nicotianae]
MPCKKDGTNTQTRSVPDKWDASNIPSLKDKVAIVTGANSGIGFITAIELARHGADVVLACRNPERSAAAAEAIREEIKADPGHGRIEEITLDTSSQSSVKTFSDEFLKRHQKLDILVNNAGCMGLPYKKSSDGFELMVATNHLGPFTLTASLMDALKRSPSARVVALSSGMHHSAKYTPGQLFMPEDKHSETTVYGNSKLYNLFFAFELGRRLESAGISNITSVACHPGATDSSLLSNAGNQGIFLKRWLYNFMNATLTQSTAMGALPTLYAAVAPDVKNGDFYGPGGIASMRGYPSLQEPAEIARSPEAAADVWATTENILGFKFKIE